jgi:hypothetical protein
MTTKTKTASKMTPAEEMRALKERAKELQGVLKSAATPSLFVSALLSLTYDRHVSYIADLQGNERAMGRTQAKKDLLNSIPETELNSACDGIVLNAMKQLRELAKHFGADFGFTD